MKAYMLKLLIGSIVRWLMTSISVWVIAYNVFSNGSYWVFGLGMLGAVGMLVWSQVQKLRVTFEVDLALLLPERSSFADLEKVIQ